MAILHADLLIFLGIASIPFALLVKYWRIRGLDPGLLLILIGGLILSGAALVDYLEETALRPLMESFADKEEWNLLVAAFGYVPGTFVTGLGLMRWFEMSKRLEEEVQLHGGEITVTSEKGKGTEVRLSFPQSRAGAFAA